MFIAYLDFLIFEGPTEISSLFFLMVVFFLLTWSSSLYILDTSSLSVIESKYHFPLCGFPFYSLYAIFPGTAVLKFSVNIVPIISFKNSILCVLFKKYLPIPKSQIYFHTKIFRASVVLSFTFRTFHIYSTWNWFFFVFHMRKGSKLIFFPYGYPVHPTVIEKMIFSPKLCKRHYKSSVK